MPSTGDRFSVVQVSVQCVRRAIPKYRMTDRLTPGVLRCPVVAAIGVDPPCTRRRVCDPKIRRRDHREIRSNGASIAPFGMSNRLKFPILSRYYRTAQIRAIRVGVGLLPMLDSKRTGRDPRIPDDANPADVLRSGPSKLSGAVMCHRSEPFDRRRPVGVPGDPIERGGAASHPSLQVSFHELHLRSVIARVGEQIAADDHRLRAVPVHDFSKRIVHLHVAMEITCEHDPGLRHMRIVIRRTCYSPGWHMDHRHDSRDRMGMRALLEAWYGGSS